MSLYDGVLPQGVRSRFIDGINGLRMHVLEAGWEGPRRPLVVLLHGFPELAWSWRKVIGPLAAAGFHVVAPDQRGYGHTTGWDPDYDGDLGSYRMFNLVRDVLGLVTALGYGSVASVVGHDFGASVAAWCAVLRPDVFRSLSLMSAPFAGPPSLTPAAAGPDIHAGLAALVRPRKHYQWYYSTRPANEDMWHCPQGVHAFLRAYYHHKSADWTANRPFRLAAWSAEEVAKMPTYYVMDLHKDMAAQVAEEIPSAPAAWLTEEELRVYSETYRATGFQGGLQWYRVRTTGLDTAEQQIFAGRRIDIPFLFVAGSSDWGVQQRPGAFEKMRDEVCTRVVGCHLLEGAGHWVQQEQPARVTELLVDLVARVV